MKDYAGAPPIPCFTTSEVNSLIADTAVACLCIGAIIGYVICKVIA